MELTKIRNNVTVQNFTLENFDSEKIFDETSNQNNGFEVTNLLNTLISNLLYDLIEKILDMHHRRNNRRHHLPRSASLTNNNFDRSAKMGISFSNKKLFWCILSAVAMALLIIFVAIFASVSTFHIRDDSLKNGNCLLDLNSDLTYKHPLILNDTTGDFIIPGPQGIFLQNGEKVLLVCAGNVNHLLVGSQSRELTVECVKDKLFTAHDGNEILKKQFNEFKCYGYPESKAKRTGQKCSEKYTEIEIGFDTSKGFKKVITTCFDDVKKDSLYSYYHLSSMIDKQQIKVPRPDEFHDGGFYQELQAHPNSLYKKTHQINTVAKILKSDELAKKYIKLNDDEFFLSRGHLTAKADFLYGSQQRATFYFVNVAPQWQIFNKENWNTLEQDVRAFASHKRLDLIVYTGTWGVTTLPNDDGVETPLHLYLDFKGTDHKITVPEIYWKVLYHPETKQAVAFVGHNNPYDEKVNQKMICKDVCENINWLHWNAQNVKEGYSYCCDVEDLRKTITYLPQFEVSKTLV